MRFAAVRGAPQYEIPRPALAAAAIATVLAAVVVAALAMGGRQGPVVCLFRAATGLPCPFCGFLRSAALIVRGEFGAAVATNPLDAVFLVAGLPLALLAWVASRAIGLSFRLTLSPAERRAIWLTLALALAANWAFVIYHSAP